ncbi:MAG: glycosyltransferase family 4 protein [Acidimicrobiales bacterium]
MARPLIARGVQRQVAISQFVAECVDGTATVIPNGVPNAECGRHDQRVVLMAQRLEREKATEMALDAWSRAGIFQDGWRLVIAGEGAQRQALTEQAGRLPQGSVSLVGFLPDLQQLMATSAVFLATAPAEPFGLSVVEAMAAGLPVVAPAGGANLETVGRCSPELLFPPGDVAGCAERLRALAADAELRARAGLVLRRYQRAEYSLDVHVARLLELYDDVLTGRHG